MLNSRTLLANNIISYSKNEDVLLKLLGLLKIRAYSYDYALFNHAAKEEQLIIMKKQLKQELLTEMLMLDEPELQHIWQYLSVKSERKIKYKAVNYYIEYTWNIFVKSTINLFKYFFASVVKVKYFFAKLLWSIKLLMFDDVLSYAEKAYSKHSVLFETAIKNYKLFRFKYSYKELIKKNCSDPEILYQFFKLIKNESNVNNSERYELLLAAECALLETEQKIPYRDIGIYLVKRVGNNLNNLLDNFKNMSEKSSNNIEYKDKFSDYENKIKTVKVIITKFVKLIAEKEFILQEFKITEDKTAIEAMEAMYNLILNYKRKLYTFILKTDMWSLGKNIQATEIFDINYINNQFNKIPNYNQLILNNDVLTCSINNENQNKGILKLFAKTESADVNRIMINCEKIAYDVDVERTIRKLEIIKSKEISSNIKDIINVYKRMCFTYSKNIIELDCLALQVEQLLADPKTLGRFSQLVSSLEEKKILLKSKLQEIIDNKKDVLLRIGIYLCKYLHLEIYLNNKQAKLNCEIVGEKIQQFIKQQYPKISEEELIDLQKLIKLEYEGYISDIDSCVKEPLKFFQILEEFKFETEELKKQVIIQANLLINNFHKNVITKDNLLTDLHIKSTVTPSLLQS